MTNAWRGPSACSYRRTQRKEVSGTRNVDIIRDTLRLLLKRGPAPGQDKLGREAAVPARDHRERIAARALAAEIQAVVRAVDGLAAEGA